MKKIALIGLALAGCQLSQSEQAAITELGSVVAKVECARLSPDAATDMVCVDAAGVAITVAQAKVQGLLATKRITKG